MQQKMVSMGFLSGDDAKRDGRWIERATAFTCPPSEDLREVNVARKRSLQCGLPR